MRIQWAPMELTSSTRPPCHFDSSARNRTGAPKASVSTTIRALPAGTTTSPRANA